MLSSALLVLSAVFSACLILTDGLSLPVPPLKKKVARLSESLVQTKFPGADCDYRYDLIIVGAGPGGESAAVRAAKLGRRVAIVELKSSFGGPTGLTSKAVREAAKTMSNAVSQLGPGNSRLQMRRLWKANFGALREEAEIMQCCETRGRLAVAGVDVFIGKAKFMNDTDMTTDVNTDMTTLQVCRPGMCVPLSAPKVIIATGSRPYRPKRLNHSTGSFAIPWSPNTDIDATRMASVRELPTSIAIIGGGVIAVEYATVMAKLKVGVTLLLPSKSKFMTMLSSESRAQLKRRCKLNNILILEQEISDITTNFTNSTVPKSSRLSPPPVTVHLSNGEKLNVCMVLYSGGRVGNTHKISCENVGVELTKYERVKVSGPLFTTSNRNIHAIGDVVGPPGLASSAMKQARLVVDGIFNTENSNPPLFSDDVPLTLWTFPEVAAVGLTSAKALELQNAAGGGRGSVVTGYAYFKDCARGRIMDPEGYVKVTAEWREDEKKHVVRGFEIIGE